MPEGAEVRIIGEGLSRKVGSRICSAIVPMSGRYTKKTIPGIDIFEKSKVTGVGVKGKLIFWIFNNETFLLNTLGMSGSWSDSPDQDHTRVRFDFTTGSSVFFVDTRNFGTLKLVSGKREFLKKLNSLGPDMLNENVSIEKFIESLDRKPHWTLAKALMDQTIVSGVGNYVKAESLYRAKLSPHRLVGSLSSSELKSLNVCIQAVLRQAYDSRGASISSYSDIDGKEGKASLLFMVYGKKNGPCGNNVVREKTEDGRTTHWVPNIQK
tara:strand:+ start:923 stop:1723 length:801 start_codon:yes stop_codon:yes gene_type:complete